MRGFSTRLQSPKSRPSAESTLRLPPTTCSSSQLSFRRDLDAPTLDVYSAVANLQCAAIAWPMNTANMESHNPNHPYNGVGSQQERPDPRSAISRPFTLQEALPYSPQTSTVPFIPDIIPDPTIGSGSPAPPVTSLFTRHEFERLNEEAGNQDQLPKSVKHAVEYVLQDLIPTRKTQ
jgi:hypothetical protein